MLKLMPNIGGKIVNYNKVTGSIIVLNNGEEVLFHEKDLLNNSNNILNKEVEFNIEILQNGDKVARNIEVLKK